MADYEINWNRIWKVARWPLVGIALITAFYMGTKQKPSSLEKTVERTVSVDTTVSTDTTKTDTLTFYTSQPEEKYRSPIEEGKGQGQRQGQGRIAERGKGGQGQGQGY